MCIRDSSYLRCIPNLVVMAPSDENECRRMLSTAFHHAGPAAVRYPRGAGTGAAIEAGLETLAIGQALVRRESQARAGSRIAILGFGTPVLAALRAAEALDATVVDMRFVKPIDRETLSRIAQSHDAIVTVEDNVIMGGAGSACAEALQEAGCLLPVLRLGLPDRFVDHGDQALLLADAGLDAAGIERQVRARFGELLREPRRLKAAS